VLKRVLMLSIDGLVFMMLHY